MIKFKKTIFQILREDIYLFRLEIIIIGGLVVLPYIMVVFILERALYTPTALSVGANYFTYSILAGFQYQFLFFMNCGFVLFVTIFTTFLNCCRKKSTIGERILEDLKDDQLYKLFLEYLESEFSQENLICYMDVQKFKKEKNDENRKRMAQDNFLNYFNGNQSTLEVNVDQKGCEVIKSKLDRGEVDESLFDSCEMTIKSNLYDSFSRFITTATYDFWVRRSNMVKELN